MAHRRPGGGASSPSSSVTDNENAIRLLESLQNDFKCLSMETKKKYPQIKEASEEAIVKLRNSAAVAADHLQQQQQPNQHHHHHQIYYVVNQILYPVVQGCETKEPKIVKMCLGTIQKLITHRAVDQKGARYITDTLWMLMESGTEHVKVLQSVTLLLTTDCVVRGETLARNLVLCFRLHFTKDSQAVINTAGATVRQLVSLVFERVLHEDEHFEQQLIDRSSRNNDDNNTYELQQQRNGPDVSVSTHEHRQQQNNRTTQQLSHHHNQYNGNNVTSSDITAAVAALGPCAADAYLMFQDLVRLVNTDRPYWLVGMTEMTRTFGLELLESVLADFQPVFYKHPEFGFLLKERVCALVIKLFSPNIKHHGGSSSGRRNTITNTVSGVSSGSGSNSSSVIMMGVTGASSPSTNHRGDDRPHYAITVRLLRLVSILVRKYHKLLITECEIFLSLIVKFLDADKPAWQRSVALEVLHRLVVEPGLLAAFCACYDLKEHSTKIFRDIIDSLAGYVQSLFNPAMVVSSGGSMNNAAMMAATTNAALQGQSPTVLAGMPVGPGVTAASGFLGRNGIWLPVVIQLPTGQAKSVYLEMNDKNDEPPQVADGYGVSVAYACLVDAVRAIQIEVHPDIHQSVVSPQPSAVSSSGNDDNRNRQRNDTSGIDQKTTSSEDNIDDDQKQTSGIKRSSLHEQIINSSWCGLLSTFCPLIESCTDEGITENMLKAMQAYIGLCGLLDMRGPRDAFITAVCRACLPPHYNLTVFNGAPNSCCSGQSMSSSTPVAQYTTSSTMYEDHHQQYNSTGSAYGPDSADYKQQQQVVVAVGTPLATPSSVFQALSSSSSSNSLLNHGPVMLTAKNLQCMRALLVLAHCHGSILGSSWHLVLTTLQHLVWILGLKPSTGGSLKAGNGGTTTVANRHPGVTTSATVADGAVGSLSSSSGTVATSTSSNVAVITTAVMAADLPVLSTMLSRLFESSRYLDDVALHHLIDALCKLSHEAMELAYCNREPSLFAVAKLLETGLVNLFRIDILWRPVTNHMLDVCQHPHIRMREWGVEAITYLVKAALQYKYQPPLKDNQRLQTLLLSPLAQLSLNMHGDVRQRQLECVLQVLHGSGETLSHGWPLVLNIVGAVSDRHGENLIRIAFQCLQLVVTDFLPLMPCKCLPLCLETTAKFGMQTRELNISLTAVGLMWNVADYFNQNKDKLLCNNNSNDSNKLRGVRNSTGEVTSDENVDLSVEGITLTDPQELVYPDFPGVATLAEMSEFDKLWMCLFTKLGELCIDPRPAVRKSAGQTLFSTISAHANLLTPSSWNAVLWQVLFPLMNKVQILCESASDSTCNTVAASDSASSGTSGSNSGTGAASGGTILIHHSRNTDQKQWAETQVSTLYGLARVFNAEKYSMTVGGDFIKAWTLLLEYMEKAASNRNVEVSLAGLRSLHELLMVYSSSSSNNSVGDSNTITTNDSNLMTGDRMRREDSWQSKNGVGASATIVQAQILSSEAAISHTASVDDEIWACTWTVWMRIATAATTMTGIDRTPNMPAPTTANTTSNNNSSNSAAEDRRRREYHQPQQQLLQHKQQFLTALLQIFPLIFTRIKTRFTDNDLNDLFCVLDAAAAVDGSAAVVLSDSHHHHHHFHQQQFQQQNYYGSSYSQQQLTRLQDEILQCLDTLERETLLFEDDEFGGTATSVTGASDSVSTNCRGVNDKKNPLISEHQQRRRQQLVQRFLCPLFDQLLKFCRFVCPPPPSTTSTMNTSVNNGDRQQLTNGSSAATVDHFHHHNKFAAAVAVDSNYVAFGEKAVLMVVDLYGMTANEPCVVKGEILRRIIEVFSVPLAGRYSSYSTPATSFLYHLDGTTSSSGTTQQQQQQHVQQQQQQHLMLVRRRQQQQQNTWKLLVVGLMNVLSVGVPLARDSNGNDYLSIWSPLGSVLEDILFPKNLPQVSTMVKNNKLVDDNDENESVIIDCQLVEFLKDEILSQSTNVPREFIMRVVVLLNRGSVLSTSTASTMANYPYSGGGYDSIMMIDCREGGSGVSGGAGTGSGISGSSPPSLLREQFAKVCFETLLQFSLVDGISSPSSPPPPVTAMTNNGSHDSTADAELITGKLAVTALLHRFQEVVEKFCHDQNLTGKCPLPRYRMSEISFVLKAIATLIVSLKKTPDKVNKAVWDQLVRLYPCLVRCVPYTQQCCSSPQVTDSLTEALLQYGDLLLKAPPPCAADAHL